ncbi:MAG TPA: hypothetical protein VLB68_11820 [Pyrinomonadaceae bacterium]|nr:hypothetical protein [Pyrinomonadaceae bacterium]
MPIRFTTTQNETDTINKIVITTMKNWPTANSSSNVPTDDKINAHTVVIIKARTGVPPLFTVAAFSLNSPSRPRANMMRGPSSILR